MDFIHHPRLQWIIQESLKEDTNAIGDLTTQAIVPSDARLTMVAYYKEDTFAIIAGIAFAKALFEYLDPNMQWEAYVEDGDKIEGFTPLFKIIGNARALLTGERTALNAMQRMSGIATLTHQAVQQIQHTKAKLLDTRKTTPLVRFLEKWAVAIGGGVNHRFGLYDAVMIKDNHIDFAGSLTKAFQKVKQYLEQQALDVPIIVEVRNFDELEEALALEGITRILLDNFSTEDLRKAVQRVQGKIPLEASGGITIERLKAVAETGVDFISVGFITHQARAKDIALKVVS